MVWSLDGDDAKGSLISAIDRGLRWPGTDRRRPPIGPSGGRNGWPVFRNR